MSWALNQGHNSTVMVTTTTGYTYSLYLSSGELRAKKLPPSTTITQIHVTEPCYTNTVHDAVLESYEVHGKPIKVASCLKPNL